MSSGLPRGFMLLLLAALVWWMAATPAAAQLQLRPPASPIALNSASIDLAVQGRLFRDDGQAFPVTAAGLPAMLARLKPAAKVDLLGGSYWLYAELRNDGRQAAWVIDPNDTLIDMVDIQVYGEDGSTRQMLTGYRQPHPYLLHYGRDVDLQPGQRYQVLMRFSSPYYARTPVMSVLPRAAYQQLVARENVLIIGSIGALLALTVFNFFIYSITRDRSSLYYSLYVLCYAVAWGMTFHLSADLFGWHDLHWHYVPFFLLPVLSTLFYTTFLRLKEHAPRLYALSRVNLVLPLLTLPSCFFFLSYAHTIATIVISVWMTRRASSCWALWR
jgi:hypothetical protein